jgi:predicted ferric reductase
LDQAVTKKAWMVGLILLAMISEAALWTYLNIFHGPISLHRFMGQAGDFLGLFGLLSFMVMVALGTRFQWIEHSIGLDKVYGFHKIFGIALFFILFGHAFLRTLAFSMRHGGVWAWSFLFYFSTRNVALFLGHTALYLLILLVPLAIWGRHRISFWFWKNSHFLVYPVVTIGFIHAWLEQGKQFASFSNLVLFISAAAVLIFLSLNRLMNGLRLKRYATWKVAGVRKETYDTATLVLERPEGPGPFGQRRAGQFAIVRVRDGKKWSEPHPFTISAPPNSDELHFTIKAAGRFTSAIPYLVPGTEVLCEGPYGIFSMDFLKEHKIVMISGGVGITPFLSSIRHAAKTGVSASIILFCCNKTLDDIIASEELILATGKLNLKIVHVLSKVRNEDLPTGIGRITYESGHLTPEMISEYVPSGDASFYLCGPPAMQSGTLKALKKALGVPAWKVKRETFFY